MNHWADRAWQTLGDAVAWVDHEGRVRWCTPALAALLGLPAPGDPWPPGTLQQQLPGLPAEAPAQPWHGLVARSADGAPPLDAQWLPADGGSVLRLADAAERERALQRHLEDRERLLFTSRSVAVGEMATTLAHELNQPLGAVSNLLRGLRARLAQLAQTPPAKLPTGSFEMLAQGAQMALDQALFASRIIGRIREYTQSRQPRRERVDLHALLRDSVALLDWELRREQVQLQLAFDPALEGRAHTTGDPVMLQQVMVNLLRNAVEAMRSTPPAERRLVLGSSLQPGAGHAPEEIELTVSDSGGGISAEAESQLFTPFFSTKPTGTGIGLHICRSFVELHQGRLWFSRPTGPGCTFHLALPRHSDAAPAPDPARTLAPQEAP